MVKKYSRDGKEKFESKSRVKVNTKKMMHIRHLDFVMVWTAKTRQQSDAIYAHILPLRRHRVLGVNSRVPKCCGVAAVRVAAVKPADCTSADCGGKELSDW